MRFDSAWQLQCAIMSLRSDALSFEDFATPFVPEQASNQCAMVCGV